MSRTQGDKDLLKKKYHYYRSKGYTAAEANKLKHHKLDNAEQIQTKNYIIKQGKRTKHKTVVIKGAGYYLADLNNWIELYGYGNTSMHNDTVYSDWGYLTAKDSDKAVTSRTNKIASAIARRDNQDIQYGYYYLYYTWLNGLTDKEMRVLTQYPNNDIEVYIRQKLERERMYKSELSYRREREAKIKSSRKVAKALVK